MSAPKPGGTLRLRRNLVFAVAWVTVLTLGAAFLVVRHAVNADQQRQLDRALIDEARQEAQEAAQLGGEHLAIHDGPGPMGNDIGPLTKYGAIYDGTGKLIDATDTFADRAPRFEAIRHPPSSCFNAWFGREHLRAVLVPLPGRTGMQLLLAAPRLDLDMDKAFLSRAMLIVFVVAVGWAALVTSWVVQRLTRGHEAIASVARRVAEGDLSARVPGAVSGPEMAQLAHDVNRMIERLSALLASQQEFVAHAAHEMRSPLTTLYGELSLSLRRSRDVTGYQRSIEEALDSTRRLRLLAEDLLTLAAVDAAAPGTDEPMLPARIIEQAVHTVSNLAEDREVAVRIEGRGGPLSGRPRDLERLFRNLIENAIRHSPQGGVVAVRVTSEPGTLIFTVSDQGTGIAEADAGHIFEPFYRASQDRADAQSGGVGLGLTIARKIARSHGGDVTIGPLRQGGAQFIVRLPAL